MNFKRSLTNIATLSLVLALSSCGSNKKPDDKQTDQPLPTFEFDKELQIAVGQSKKEANNDFTINFKSAEEVALPSLIPCPDGCKTIQGTFVVTYGEQKTEFTLGKGSEKDILPHPFNSVKQFGFRFVDVKKAGNISKANVIITRYVIIN